MYSPSKNASALSLSIEGNFSIQFLQCRENCVGTIKDVGGALFEFYMKDVGELHFNSKRVGRSICDNYKRCNGSCV